MKRLIYNNAALDIERIVIDFYGVGALVEEVEAASKGNIPKKAPLSNSKVVIRDVTAHLSKKGLKVLNSHVSSNTGSNSTYYDIDIKVKDPSGEVKYVYLRVSDHPEDPNMIGPRNKYHENLTRKYENLPDSAVVDDMYVYTSIEVAGKVYDRYDKAMNKVKQLIDQALAKEGIT